MTQTNVPKDRKLGRRSLVRAGVWSVPVVSVAAAAPAFAACSGSSDLTSSTLNSTSVVGGAGSRTYTISVTLNNTGGTTSGLAVSASSDGGAVTSVSGTGFTSGTTSATADSQISCGGSLTTTLTVVVATNKASTITLVFTSTDGGTGYTVSFKA